MLANGRVMLAHKVKKYMDKNTLARRYTSLWTGEITSATLFAALLLWSALRDNHWQHWLVRGYSVSVVIFILIQGTVWWRWKLHVLKQNQRTIPESVLRRYRMWRTINWGLIACFPLVVFAALSLADQPASSLDKWLGLLFWLGAILEQINYYYVQLMYNSRYDWQYVKTQRRLRTGTVAKALQNSKLE